MSLPDIVFLVCLALVIMVGLVAIVAYAGSKERHFLVDAFVLIIAATFMYLVHFEY